MQRYHLFLAVTVPSSWLLQLVLSAIDRAEPPCLHPFRNSKPMHHGGLGRVNSGQVYLLIRFRLLNDCSRLKHSEQRSTSPFPITHADHCCLWNIVQASRSHIRTSFSLIRPPTEPDLPEKALINIVQRRLKSLIQRCKSRPSTGHAWLCSKTVDPTPRSPSKGTVADPKE